MARIQNLWLKFCCYVTGYNYLILINCSEISVRKVKKYTAALIIVATLWAFVGYCFCSRYIKLDNNSSVIGAVISMFIIIQIERQILLGDKGNKWLHASRIILGLLMAIIGSMIIDQIIFKDDIEKIKLSDIQNNVEQLLPGRSKIINQQITQVQETITAREEERKTLLEDIDKNPTIKIIESTSSVIPIAQTTTDTVTKLSTTSTTLSRATTTNVRSVSNPKIEQLNAINRQIDTLNKQKLVKQDELINVRRDLESELKNKSGFLDELGLMFKILDKSAVAFGVYVIWLLFFLILELLILISKAKDQDSDYDLIIQKQMAIHMRKVELL